MKMRAAVFVLALAVCATAWAQPRAYRGINFGDSVQTVATKVLSDTTLTGPYRSESISKYSNMTRLTFAMKYGVATDAHAWIAGFPFVMTFEFYQDQLFQMSFTSASWDADYFDTSLRAAQGDLVSVITQAHGPPDLRYDVGLLDMQSGYNMWSDVWKTKASGVSYKIGIGETDSSTFNAVLWIQYAPLLDKYNQALKDKQNAAQKKSAGDF